MDRILLDSILQNILNVRSVYTDNLKGIETDTLLAIIYGSLHLCYIWIYHEEINVILGCDVIHQHTLKRANGPASKSPKTYYEQILVESVLMTYTSKNTYVF